MIFATNTGNAGDYPPWQSLANGSRFEGRRQFLIAVAAITESMSGRQADLLLM